MKRLLIMVDCIAISIALVFLVVFVGTAALRGLFLQLREMVHDFRVDHAYWSTGFLISAFCGPHSDGTLAYELWKISKTSTGKSV